MITPTIEVDVETGEVTAFNDQYRILVVGTSEYGARWKFAWAVRQRLLDELLPVLVTSPEDARDAENLLAEFEAPLPLSEDEEDRMTLEAAAKEHEGKDWSQFKKLGDDAPYAFSFGFDPDTGALIAPDLERKVEEDRQKRPER